MSGLKGGPSKGSRAYLALTKIYLAGGCGDLNALLTACNWGESIREFERVIDRLHFLQLIAVDDGIYTVTPRGLVHIGVDADAPAVVPQVPVGPRLFVPDRTLSRKYMVRMPLTREGAHDYASIPSRMGDVVKPHLAGEGLVGGDRASFRSKA